MDIKKTQDNLKKGLSITQMDSDTINYLQTPLGKAFYKSSVGRPRKKEEDKAKHNDRVICDICGGSFTRSHRSSHNKTKIHLLHKNMNDKLKKLLIP